MPSKIIIILGDIENDVRNKDDCTYAEYKEDVVGAFHLYEEDGWPAEHVTNYLAEDDWYGEGLIGTSAFLWYISIATREVELGCLEDRVLAQISYHIPLYDNGDYNDLEPEEKAMVDKDVDFIKSKVELIPVDQLKED